MSNESTETVDKLSTVNPLEPEEPKSPMKLLFIVFPLVILSVLEHGIALPVLPAAGRFFGAKPVEIGLLFSIQYVGLLLVSPAWGWLSDRFGRKTMFILTLLTGGIAEVIVACSTSLNMLLIGRFLVGVTAGNIPIASALMSDMTTERDRSSAMALIGISYGLGFVLGPPIGGIAAAQGGRTATGVFNIGLPFFIAAMILFAAAILALIFVPKAERYAEITAWNHKVSEKRAAEFAAANAHLKGKKNWFPLISAALMCILYLGYTVAGSMVETRLSPYLEDIFKLDPKSIGYTFGLVGVVMLFVQGSVRHLSKFVSDFQLCVFGGFVAGVAYLLSSIVDTYTLFVIIYCFVSIGRGLLFPGMLAVTSKCYDSPKMTGKVMGVFNSSGALGRIAGPVLSGIIVERFTLHTPFLTAGIIFVLMILLWAISWIFVEKRRLAKHNVSPA